VFQQYAQSPVLSFRQDVQFEHTANFPVQQASQPTVGVNGSVPGPVLVIVVLYQFVAPLVFLIDESPNFTPYKSHFID